MKIAAPDIQTKGCTKMLIEGFGPAWGLLSSLFKDKQGSLPEA